MTETKPCSLIVVDAQSHSGLGLMGHSDEATTLRYYVRDAFSDEDLFGGM